MIPHDAFLFDKIVAQICSSSIMQREEIHGSSQLECRRYMQLRTIPNDRTVDRTTDGIIFVEPGARQQETPVAQVRGLTIIDFLWHMVLPSE